MKLKENFTYWRLLDILRKLIVHTKKLTNLRGDYEDLVRNMLDLTGDCGKTNSRENVAVITLSRIIRLAIEINPIERTSTREHTAPIGMGIGLLGSALGLHGRIGQRKHNRILIHLSHGVQNTCHKWENNNRWICSIYLINCFAGLEFSFN